MSEVNSTNPSPSDKPNKPSKPYPEFPLFPHAAGVWAKKIRGKLHYFGPWNDPDGALKKYLAEKTDLHAGRMPRPDPDALTVKELANQFLGHKRQLVNEGRLSPVTWGDYKTACDEIVAGFGKHRLVSDLRPDDFAGLRKRMAKKWGLERLTKNIQFIRCVFKYAFDSELITVAIRYGPAFKRPSKRDFRLHRAKRGAKLLTAEEIRRMLGAAGVQLRAMILLGINAGFGNADCGNLPLSAVDLERGIIDYPHPKTGILRRCTLWPETVAALKEALARQPEPKDSASAGLFFTPPRGGGWFRADGSGPLTSRVAKLIKKLHINGRRGLGFYTLRHTFRTVADEAKDQPAADFVMGHESPHMSSVYRERISDERLKAVTDHVRSWLFGGGEMT